MGSSLGDTNFMRIMIKTILGMSILAASVAITPNVEKNVSTTQSEPIEIPKVSQKPVWTCPDCTLEEKYVLEKLQEKTRISDRNALATIMGNIKQESKFIPNICEGGARVSYNDCNSGGYGLIQWTSIGRYKGLGNFAARFCEDGPSTLECQTRYMINEPIFQKYLPMFEGSGQTVSQYMVPAYYWLGWGIKGNREIYSYNYTKKLVLT